MDHPLRPILPASGQPHAVRPESKTPKPARVARPNACTVCRTKKTRCDGGKPSCSPCLRRSTHCAYDAQRGSSESVRRELREQRDLLHQMRTAPAMEALAIMQRLRAAPDSSTKSDSSVEGRALGMHRPSALRTARAASPPTFSGLEFELMACHPMAYPAILPLDLTKVDLGPRPKTNAHLPLECGARGGASGIPQLPLPEGQAKPCRSGSSQHKVATDQAPHLPAGPRRRQLCDDRLHQLRIGYWTSVEIDDELAASIISYYLEVNHPILGFFDADLFVADLVDHRLRFCSPFLIDALLCFACQSYSIVDERASALVKPFFSSAEMMWRAERSSDTVANLSALLLFSACCHLQVCSIQVIDLFEDMQRMGKRMRLFGVQSTPEEAVAFRDLGCETKQAMAHSAWGAYNWLTMNMFYMLLRPVEFPPMLPIPGNNTTWQHDKNLDVQWPPHVLPWYAGKTFTAVCKFWPIMQEVGAVYFAQRLGLAASPARPPLAFAESKFQKLLAFADSPSQDMSRREYNPDHIVAFHILFHSAVIDILHPFVDDPSPQPLRSFSSPLSSVRAAFRASTNQLQRLMLTCRLQNPRTLSLVVTNTVLVHVSNAMLADAKASLDSSDRNPDWRFYFFLCLTSCQDAMVCFPVFEHLGRGLLAMAIRDGAIGSDEAHAWKRALEECRREGSPSEEVMFGDFTIDFNLATKEPERAKARSMAASFEEMVDFNKFTAGEDFLMDSEG